MIPACTLLVEESLRSWDFSRDNAGAGSVASIIIFLHALNDSEWG